MLLSVSFLLIARFLFYMWQNLILFYLAFPSGLIHSCFASLSNGIRTFMRLRRKQIGQDSMNTVGRELMAFYCILVDNSNYLPYFYVSFNQLVIC